LSNKATYYPETIPLIFSSDNYFVPYISTMMQSIMENCNKNKKYSFYILYRNITKEFSDLLKEQIRVFPNFSLDLVDISSYIKDYKFFTSNRSNITIETYFRLLIPELFSNYKKVIYLDGDMICCTDISELYNFELGDNIIAGAKDTNLLLRYYSGKLKPAAETEEGILNLRNPENYFCAGLLIINIAEFKKCISTKDLLEFAVSKNWRLHDQDILNVLFEGKILYLPFQWNFLYIHNFINICDVLPKNLKDEYFHAQKMPKIIHFATSIRRPWSNLFNRSNFQLFWKYATRTPFLDTIILRMYEQDLISDASLSDHVLSNIKHRRGIGLKLILKYIAAWFFRDSK
jgi:lipopolysaccharide biosynthesis glycosyltransferase